MGKKDNNKCCNEIKSLSIHHKKCHQKNRPAVMVLGSFLNQYCSTTTKALNDNQNYQICHNLASSFRLNRIPVPPKQVIPLPKMPAPSFPPMKLPPPSSRDDRLVLMNAKRMQVDYNEMIEKLHKENEYLKDSIETLIAAGYCNNDDDADDDADDMTSQPAVEKEEVNNKKRKKLSSNKNFFVDHQKKTFKDLCLRRRQEKVNALTNRIIGVCIDNAELKCNGLKYIEKNEAFAHEVMNVINGIFERLNYKLKIDVKGLKNVEACELIDEDEEKIERERDQSMMKLALAIMGETTGRAYGRILKVFKETFASTTTDTLPTEYKLNKKLPLEIEPVLYCVPINDVEDEEINEDENLEESLIFGHSGNVKKENEGGLEDGLLMLSKNTCTEDGKSISQVQVVGAKLKGGLLDYLNVMIGKITGRLFEDEGGSPSSSSTDIEEGEPLIMLSSFDGAESFRSSKKVDTVVTFSSQVFSSKSIQEQKIFAGNSSNILTWFQYLGKEDWKTMEPAMSSYYEERKRLVLGHDKPAGFDQSKLWVYDMHDAKLCYELLQHSLWNRKYHRFLLCGCKAHARVYDNDSSKCAMLNDNEYKQRWGLSKERWEHWSQPGRTLNKKAYTKSKHKIWCDSENLGITHFGVNPDVFPTSHLRFDMFHLKCAITRSVMNECRDLIMKQSQSLRDSWTERVLKDIFHKFHIFCWNYNFAFSVMKGNDLGMFIVKIPRVTEFLKTNLIQTNQVKNMVEALDLLPIIFEFMSKSYIEDEELYLEQLEEFKINLELFYKNGRTTFLLENESFYHHCMRFYLPRIAEKTYNRHKLGLGVFNMQGFERRNKESKNTLHRFSTMNRKSPNFLINNC